MMVAIDTNGLYTTKAGVARYIRGLVHGLRELPPPEFALVSIAWEVENFDYRQPARALKTLYRDLVWRFLVGPQRLARLAPDLFHSLASGFVRPPKHIPWVATLHDLATQRFPKRYRYWHRINGRSRTRLALSARRTICISQFTADEAMRLFSVPASQLEVIYNGCDFHPDLPPPAESQPSVALPSEFFLFVGSLEPGKNLRFLRQVYELAACEGVVLPPLVIVGARWLGVADEGRPPANWHYLGRQDDAVLVHLYRRSLALAFPSIYEGFGLPVVEAMALRCPVVCAPVASLPEVGGDAACYAELSPSAWLKVLRELAQDPRRRDELAAAGVDQARRFSWPKCARETFSVYQAVCTGG